MRLHRRPPIAGSRWKMMETVSTIASSVLQELETRTLPAPSAVTPRAKHGQFTEAGILPDLGRGFIRDTESITRHDLANPIHEVCEALLRDLDRRHQTLYRLLYRFFLLAL